MPPQKLYTPLAMRQFSGSAPGGDLDAIMASIKHLESRGNYQAKGQQTAKGDRAYGAYQVMGANIPSWTKEALGRELTIDEFLADPEAQDTVARVKMGQSLAKYGNPDDVASVWFTGRPYAQAGGTVADVTGTSNDDYLATFRKGLTEFGGSLGIGAPKKYIPLAQRQSIDPSGMPTLGQRPGAMDVLNLPDTLAGLPGRAAGAITNAALGTDVEVPGMFSEQVGAATEGLTGSPGAGMLAGAAAAFAVPAGAGARYIPKALRTPSSGKNVVVNAPEEVDALTTLVQNAQKYDPEFKQSVDEVAKMGDWEVAHGPVKKIERLQEKMATEGRTAEEMRDANRSTILVKNPTDLQAVVDAVEQRFGAVVRVKDKFDLRGNYESAIINIQTPLGHQAEIAVTYPEMWRAKTALGGQELYNVERVKAEGWEAAIKERERLYSEARRLMEERLTQSQ